MQQRKLLTMITMVRKSWSSVTIKAIKVVKRFLDTNRIPIRMANDSATLEMHELQNESTIKHAKSLTFKKDCSDLVCGKR